MSSSTHNPCWNLLHSVKVSDVGRMVDVATLTSENTVEDAVNLFSKYNCLSCPVLDPKTNKLTSMVDMLDVAHHLIEVCPQSKSLTSDDLQRAGRAMALRPLSQVANGSGRDPPLPLDVNQPLTLAASLFAAGVHRVAIVNPEGKITGLVSQSNVISFLADNIERGDCKHMGTKTLEELGLGQNGVVSCLLTTTVIDVIRKLDRVGMSGVALTNPAGRLSGNFSVTDLRGLWNELLPKFNISAGQYLQEHHPGSLKVQPLLLETATLAQVIKKMSSEKVHRVWVINKKGETTGVVSITDVMKVVKDLEMLIN